MALDRRPAQAEHPGEHRSSPAGHVRRRSTRFEHNAEIVAVYGYRDFAAAAGELVGWLDDRPDDG